MSALPDPDTTNLLANWAVEVAVGLGVVLLGILKWIGKGALSDIRNMKEANYATHEDLSTCQNKVGDLIREEMKMIREEIRAVHERIDDHLE